MNPMYAIKNNALFFFTCLVVILVITSGVLLWMGRVPWCTCGEIWLWSGDVQSSNNSQHISDPYTFTHIEHGVGFYALFAVVAPEWSLGARFLSAVTAESLWEILENTDMVINRYRAATISLDYYGDSVVNSLGDIVACMIGFWFTSRFSKWKSVFLVVVLEVVLVAWIRDSLLLNIVMLIHPIAAIKVWQGGV